MIALIENQKQMLALTSSNAVRKEHAKQCDKLAENATLFAYPTAFDFEEDYFVESDRANTTVEEVLAQEPMKVLLNTVEDGRALAKTGLVKCQTVLMQLEEGLEELPTAIDVTFVNDFQKMEDAGDTTGTIKAMIAAFSGGPTPYPDASEANHTLAQAIEYAAAIA